MAEENCINADGSKTARNDHQQHKTSQNGETAGNFVEALSFVWSELSQIRQDRWFAPGVSQAADITELDYWKSNFRLCRDCQGRSNGSEGGDKSALGSRCVVGQHISRNGSQWEAGGDCLCTMSLYWNDLHSNDGGINQLYSIDSVSTTVRAK